jgi:hypothetical protein
VVAGGVGRPTVAGVSQVLCESGTRTAQSGPEGTSECSQRLGQVQQDDRWVGRGVHTATSAREFLTLLQQRRSRHPGNQAGPVGLGDDRLEAPRQLLDGAPDEFVVGRDHVRLLVRCAETLESTSPDAASTLPRVLMSSWREQP